MRSIAFLLVVLLFSSCEKENLQEPILVVETPKARGTNIARVQNDFMRLLSNSAMTTLLEPQFHGYQSNYFNPNVNCVTTNYTANGNVLDINFDTLAGATIPCLLPNGAQIHGDLKWDLNFNPGVWRTRECQPGFLSFNSIFVDGTIIKELRGNNVASPKFFVNTGCPDVNNISPSTDSEIALNFKVSDDFLYEIITENSTTFIDPVPSPGSFATLTTSNDFDANSNFTDLYERTYQLEINVPTGLSFCPFTKVQTFEANNNTSIPDDSYTMMTASPLVYTPFQCNAITSGILELRALPSSCSGNLTANDLDLLMTIDFSANAAGDLNTNANDGYVYICDYSVNPNSPDCELTTLEGF